MFSSLIAAGSILAGLFLLAIIIAMVITEPLYGLMSFVVIGGTFLIVARLGRKRTSYDEDLDS